MSIRLIYIMKPFRLFAMSQQSADQKSPLTAGELKTLNDLARRQQAYTVAISSSLTNNATKHILGLTDRLERVNKAKNKGKENPKHNLCLNVQTSKIPIMTSGSFNI